MKFYKIFGIVFLFSIGFFGCYTIVTHPTVKKDNYSHKVKFYNDCFSCHTNSEMIEYGYDYLHKYPSEVVVVQPVPRWIEPIYSPPWWVGIKLPTDEFQTDQRPNDRTGLRDMDGGRTSAPTNFSNPSRNTGSSSSSSSSNSSNNNSTNSSNERSSKESNSTKSRDNSGERRK